VSVCELFSFIVPLSGLWVYAACWWVVSASAAGEEKALIWHHCLASAMQSAGRASESPSTPITPQKNVTHVLTKQLSIVDVSTRIATAVDESLSRSNRSRFSHDNSSLP
jgi:hypothetical protein